MHQLCYVVFDVDHAENSEEARQFVYDYLSSSRLFNTDSEECIGDWFVVGGRWSGELAKLKLDSELLDNVEKEFGERYGWYTTAKVDTSTRLNQFKPIFYKKFPDYKGDIPYWRDSYQEQGYPDDAQIIDEKVYDEIIMREIAKRIERDNTDGYAHYMDLDQDVDLSPANTIGKKWIVVIDYHT
jgi:hypothetical protein